MSVLQIRARPPRKRRAPKGFSPKPSQLEPLVREGYIAACKLLLASLKSPRLDGFTQFDGLAEALGWPEGYVSGLGLRSTKLIAGMKARLKQLSSPALSRDERFELNVELLGNRLELWPAELAILRLAVVLELQALPSDIADHMHPRALREWSSLLAQTLDLTRPQVERALGNESALVRSGPVRPAGLVSRHVSLRERLDLIEGIAHQRERPAEQRHAQPARRADAGAPARALGLSAPGAGPGSIRTRCRRSGSATASGRLDPAVLRRLDLKVTFGYLDEQQRSAEALGLGDAETREFAARAEWRDLQSLALGDVSAAMRHVRIGCREPGPGICKELQRSATGAAFATVQSEA